MDFFRSFSPSDIVDPLSSFSGFSPGLIALAGLFALIESALGVGVLMPGEGIIMAIGATTASWEQRLALIGVVALGASAGDHIGYRLGRRFGQPMRSSGVVERIGVHRWDRCAQLLRRYGA